ncbi:VanZ family protein [Thermaerobacillus caldiproteolyticus]|uniref:Glycopeptide antibiotics resistance protein n=1 Tax=Thermaerobacillus caldiproteolyticus TaxID=247480 RepID=A0A7V9Z926_9BACL|nr:VanZ family protein [Anoxybacillus caldiproteolyticus]MBA2876196.1 glycopeptide antibiotics resistance protein [Anoxybacillus caldiproteolyticus]
MINIKPIYFILASILFVIFQAFVIIRKKEFNFWSVLAKYIFLNYCLYAIFLLFFPIYIDPRAIDTSQAVSSNINIIPFASLIDMAIFDTKYGYYTSLVKNIMGNTLLLLPLSFYLTVIWDKLKTVKTVLITSLSIPILIELIQLIENIFQGTGRKVDIDDVILNGVGFFMGYWIAVKLYSPIKEMLSQSNVSLKKHNL